MTTCCASPPYIPPTPSEAATELLRRRRARRNLLDFTTYTKADYRTNWHHRILADALTRVATGGLKRLMIFVGPQTGKSELVSRRLPAFILGINPNAKILAGTHTTDLAESMNLDCQRIMDADEYRTLFPDTRLPRTGQSRVCSTSRRQAGYFEIPGHAGSLLSAGVGKSIAGRPANIGIADDLFGSWEDAISAPKRQAVWDWWTKDFLNRLSKDAPVILTHTRWHMDDVAGRELRQMADGGEPWEIISLPSLYEGGEKHPHDPRDVGDAIWPAHKSADDLNVIRTRDLSGFEALHQQNPRGSGLVEWPDEYFRGLFYDQLPPDMPQRFRLLVLDPAMGKSAKHGDFPAIVCAVIDAESPFTVWVEDSSMRVMPADDLEDTAVAMIRRFKPHAWLAEVNGFQERIASAILRKLVGDSPPFLPWNSGAVNSCDPDHPRNKEVAIRLGLSQTLADGRLRFRNTPYNRMIVDQLREFPTGEHDDGPDAVRLLFPLLRWILTGRNGIAPLRLG